MTFGQHRCPRCNNDDPHLIHYVEVRGQYDGPIIMHCVVCGHDWPRFDPPSKWHTVAVNTIARWAALEKERDEKMQQEERDAGQ